MTTLTGSLAWVFNLCVLITSAAVVLIGTWVVWEWFIWEVLIKSLLKSLRLYKIFVHFLMYRKRYFEWVKKYEGKIEEGAND